MNIQKMSKKEFEAVPELEHWSDTIDDFDSLVILPTKRKHDSGYRVMDFVVVKEGKAIVRISGCSDVLHIDGIGGFGKWSADTGIPKSVVPKGWSIDCLPKSGLLRIFCNGSLTTGMVVSSFELFGKIPQ